MQCSRIMHIFSKRLEEKLTLEASRCYTNQLLHSLPRDNWYQHRNTQLCSATSCQHIPVRGLVIHGYVCYITDFNFSLPVKHHFFQFSVL